MRCEDFTQPIELMGGANGEGRTPIPLREPDPKSGASANSATFARMWLSFNRTIDSLKRESGSSLNQDLANYRESGGAGNGIDHTPANAWP